MENRKSLSVLFLGDIVGEAGREAVGVLVPNLAGKYKVGFIIANCENAAAGRGIDKEKALKRFLTLIPDRSEPARDNVWLNGVIIRLDRESGKSLHIERIAVPMK